MCVYVCDIISASFAYCRMVFRRSSITICLSKDSGNFQTIVAVAPRRKRTVHFVLSVLCRVYDQSRFLQNVHIAVGVHEASCSVRTGTSSQGGDAAVVFNLTLTVM